MADPTTVDRTVKYLPYDVAAYLRYNLTPPKNPKHSSECRCLECEPKTDG